MVCVELLCAGHGLSIGVVCTVWQSRHYFWVLGIIRFVVSGIKSQSRGSSGILNCFLYCRTMQRHYVSTHNLLTRMNTTKPIFSVELDEFIYK